MHSSRRLAAALLATTAGLSLAGLASGCGSISGIVHRAEKAVSSKKTTTTVRAASGAPGQGAASGPAQVSLAACDDASLSVPAPDNTAALRVVAQVLTSWGAGDRLSPSAGAPGSPALAVDVKPITANSYATDALPLVDGQIPAVSPVPKMPADDSGTWVLRIPPFRHQQAAAQTAARALAAQAAAASPPLADWSDLDGCVSAEAEWLASQPPGPKILLYSSDFEYSGSQNGSVTTPLSGVAVVAVQSCSGNAADCDQRRAEWSAHFHALGATSISWSRADDLAAAVLGVERAS